MVPSRLRCVIYVENSTFRLERACFSGSRFPGKITLDNLLSLFLEKDLTSQVKHCIVQKSPHPNLIHVTSSFSLTPTDLPITHACHKTPHLTLANMGFSPYTFTFYNLHLHITYSRKQRSILYVRIGNNFILRYITLSWSNICSLAFYLPFIWS